MRTLLACLALLPALAGAQDMRLPPETARLQQMAARFAPVDIRVDVMACRRASGGARTAWSRRRA